ncbi:MAG TPA: hypothetical protein VJS44_22600 [Pyrinomonadaceae bacterium]|nr:hypothetical protein [Pyrinomonadaceae bacterium]
MRLRRCLGVCALVVAMPLIGLAQVVTEEEYKAAAGRSDSVSTVNEPPGGLDAVRAALPVPTPLAIARKRDATYKSAYHDVYHILSTPNPCSSFFGGPGVAVEVLNHLFKELDTTKLSSTKTSMVMSGPTRRVINARTGINYRLFEKAAINRSGPFYQRKVTSAEPLVPNVGSFEPDTREARATILLHELGHLLQGSNGQWLLPNDGDSDEQSQKNTSTIEERCGEQIKQLRQIQAGVKPVAPKKGNEPQSSQ